MNVFVIPYLTYSFISYYDLYSTSFPDPPSTPVITGETTLLENRSYTFICHADRGNPDHSYRWRLGNDDRGQTSTVTIKPSYVDNGKELVCEAVNDYARTRRESVRRATTLNVECMVICLWHKSNVGKCLFFVIFYINSFINIIYLNFVVNSRIGLRISGDYVTGKTVVIRENVTSTLECLSSSNPSATATQFTWLNGGKIIRTRSQQLELGAVTNKTTGTYTCKVSVQSSKYGTLQGESSVHVTVQCQLLFS